MNKSSTIVYVAFVALCAAFADAASCPLASSIAFDERFTAAAEHFGRRSRHEAVYTGTIDGAVPHHDYSITVGTWHEWRFTSRGWARPTIRIWNQSDKAHAHEKDNIVWALERMPASILMSLPKEVVLAVDVRTTAAHGWALPFWEGAQDEGREGMWTAVVTRPVLAERGRTMLTLMHEFAHLIDFLRRVTGPRPLDPRSLDQVGHPPYGWSSAEIPGWASTYAMESEQEAFAESMTAWLVGRHEAYRFSTTPAGQCDAGDYLDTHAPYHRRLWATWATRLAASGTGRWFQR